MRLLALVFFVLAWAWPAAVGAQVTVKLQLERNSYLAGEPIPVGITLTNLTGQPLVFEGSKERPWIDFIVSSSRGVPLRPVGEPVFGKVEVPAGKTVGRSVDLSRLYAFGELGNFSIYAVVRLPHQRTEGFQSNRHLFTVSESPPRWSQRVGVPGTGKTHEYRLIQFTGGRKSRLYVQVADARSGRPLRTHQLGDFVDFRKPTAKVDSSMNMHLLYMATPHFWGYARVAPDGEFLGRELYRPTATGHPSLVKGSNGEVGVSGGIYYDAEKEAEARKNQRKASERPAFIYE
jgi:hypothetical protein